MPDDLLTLSPAGLYCPAGDFHIDPCRGVARAVITHAHADHARSGSKAYLCAAPGAGLLQERLGGKATIEALAYGQAVSLNGIRVSLHPAGHILGSAQVRVEHRGEVWVVSGDYKLGSDPTCAPFEPIRCHTFITESTFGLPIYRWPEPSKEVASISRWWDENAGLGRTTTLFAYSMGKAQRLLAELGPGPGPLLVHESIARFLPHYQAAGVALPPVAVATAEALRQGGGRALVVTPGLTDSPWLTEAGEPATAFVSGWMLVRRARAQAGAQRGFVISDHADWPGLVEAIRQTGAGRVLVTHGSAEPLARWLNETGRQAEALPSRFAAPEETPPTQQDPGLAAPNPLSED
jgi:putative mRNA 3-end processing factor